MDGSLDKRLVEGKIIVCDTESSGVPEYLAGAVGSIMQQLVKYNDTPFSYPFPAVVLSSDLISVLSSYINSSRYINYMSTCIHTHHTAYL